MLERGACTFPLARRQPRQGEQPLAGFLQAVGDSARLEPPLADEGSGALSRVVSALQRPCDFSHRLKYRTLASNAREASVRAEPGVVHMQRIYLKESHYDQQQPYFE